MPENCSLSGQLAQQRSLTGGSDGTIRESGFYRSISETYSARLVSLDQKRTRLTPGTILVREWDRQSQRVMVMADGFAWNGQTYDSLSKVAFAITGTKWNGPRFFGLRDKEERSTTGARP